MKKILVFLVLALSFAVNVRAESVLGELVTLMNAECPEDMGDGMVLQKTFIQGDNVVFQIQVQEADVVEAMSDMPDLIDSLGGMMIDSMASDEGMLMLMMLMVEEKKNLVMRFTSPGTRKVANMTIKSSKLAQSLK